MKHLLYIDIALTDAEKETFNEFIRDKAVGRFPNKWYAFEKDGVIVDCSFSPVMLSWDEVKPIITMGTLHELKLKSPIAYEQFIKMLD